MEITFNGLRMNVANNFLIQDIDGWEGFPTIRNGSSPKPRRMGSWRGGLASPDRVVTATVDIVGDPADNYNTSTPKRALRKALSLNDAESHLRVDLGFGLDPEILNARVTGLEMPTSKGYGHMQRAVIEWTATDPRRYSIATSNATTGLPVAQRGVPYPITYGRYSVQLTPGDRGEAIAQNIGNAATPAVFKITGPIRNPTVTVRGSDKGQATRIQFNTNLAAREILTANTADGSISIAGAARQGITSGALIEDMELPPGISTVTLGGVGTTAAKLNVSWRDASL